MKSVVTGVCLVLSVSILNGQSDKGADQVIEGGKVVVELIKALRIKNEKNPGCKDNYADLCIANEATITIHVSLLQRTTGEKREMVIQSHMRECTLQITKGVWTYDLRTSENPQPIRKGDLLIEGCQNLVMNIKY